MALGIYVHLAFCPYLCPYCDFAKWPYRESVAHRYLDALRAELKMADEEPAATMYFGGGTPNAYDARTLQSLVRDVRKRFPARQEAQEITVECNPELVRARDFEAYVAAGVTRVSIGVQSFVEAEARVLGRRHSSDDVRNAVRRARSAGIASVNLDLMFGIPHQTTTSWRTTLSRALELEPDHVSAYGLTVEEGTPFALWREREPEIFNDDARDAELYGIAIDTFARAGYDQYEISNFARAHHRCRHNENYWENGDYLGFGAGAASFRRGTRYVHTRSLDAYVDAALSDAPIPGDSERLSGRRRTGEAIMLALRTAQGVRLRAFKERYGIDVLEHYAPVVAQYSQAGLLEQIGDTMRLTRHGRFFANDVCAAFIGEAS